MSDTVTLHNGDCTTILPTLPSASVDCVITDPPYPEIDRDYGRMSEPEWHAMMDVVVPECRRILKPTGSAVFILQPNSERVGRMRPWLWEFMAKWCREWNMPQDAWWWNDCQMPGGGEGNRRGLLRPSVKPCVWLGSADCYRDRESVHIAAAASTMRMDSAKARYNKSFGCHGIDRKRIYEKTQATGLVTPFNLLPFGNESRAGMHGHPAGTPHGLCDWWLRYICPPGGTVLDPFIGSGTVGIAAVNRGCNVVGIERMPKYFATAERRIAAAQAERAEMAVVA